MNEEEFKVKTGRPPKDDDLERVNCPIPGQIGHFSCGWCNKCDQPRFQCGCALETSVRPPITKASENSRAP